MVEEKGGIIIVSYDNGIHFNVDPDDYEKEKSGIKNNLAVVIDFKYIDDVRAAWEKHNNLLIEIENNETGEYFVRELRDVTFEKLHCFGWLTVFTWDEAEPLFMDNDKAEMYI